MWIAGIRLDQADLSLSEGSIRRESVLCPCDVGSVKDNPASTFASYRIAPGSHRPFGYMSTAMPAVRSCASMAVFSVFSCKDQ